MPHVRAALAAALLLALAAPSAMAQALVGVSAPSHDVELAFTVEGRIAEVLVTPGQRVDVGQPLVRLDDRKIAATEELLRLRAASDLSIQAADAEWRMAENERERIEDAFNKGAMAHFELERAKLQVRQREIALRLAEQRQQEARLQLEQSLIRRADYTINARAAGVVEEVRVEPGETVDRLQPVVRLVSADPLWVEVSAPLNTVARVRLGDRAQVTPNAPTGVTNPIVVGEVIHIAAVADAASGTRLVRIAVPNPAGLPAGSRMGVAFVGRAE